MSMNIILFVPHILIAQRFTGAMSAILWSVPLSMVLLYGFTRTLKQFPEQGAPEILARLLPGWFLRPYLVLYGLMIFCAGLFVVAAFSTIVSRFIFPHMPFWMIPVSFCAVISLGATRSTRAVISFSEIILYLNIPLVLIILSKAIFGRDLNVDEVRTMSDYIQVPPHPKSLAAATYVFSGYTSMGIVNRLQKKEKKKVHYGLIAVFGFLILAVSFLVPIGFHGTKAVNNFTFVWISTSDSMRMPYGVVERVLFLFLFLYLNLSLMFASFTWHVGAELIKSGVLRAKPDPFVNRNVGASWIVVGFFSVITILYAILVTFRSTVGVVVNWNYVRLGAEILLVVLMTLSARKGKRL